MKLYLLLGILAVMVIGTSQIALAATSGLSCGKTGGNYCSSNGSCPNGSSNLGKTYDCNPCCKTSGSPTKQTPTPSKSGPSCGKLTGNKPDTQCVSRVNSCPGGYNNAGQTYDCGSCCVKQSPSPVQPTPDQPISGLSCGKTGGNYCSSSGSCPRGTSNLGKTYDCNPCCIGTPEIDPPPKKKKCKWYNPVCQAKKVFDTTVDITKKTFDVAADVTKKTYKGAKYVAKKTYEGAKYVAKKNYEGVRYISKKNYEGAKYVGEKTFEVGKRTFEGTVDVGEKVIDAGKKTFEGAADVGEKAVDVGEKAVDAGEKASVGTAEKEINTEETTTIIAPPNRSAAIHQTDFLTAGCRTHMYPSMSSFKRASCRNSIKSRGYTDFYIYAYNERDYGGPGFNLYTNPDSFRVFLNELIADGLRPVVWLVPDDAGNIHKKSDAEIMALFDAFIPKVNDLVSSYVLCLECDEYWPGNKVDALGNYLNAKTNKPIGVHQVPGKWNYAKFGWVDFMVLQYGFGKNASFIQNMTRSAISELGKPVVAGEYSVTKENTSLGDAAVAAGASGFGNGGKPY